MTWAPKVGEWVWVVDTGKVGEVITVWNGWAGIKCADGQCDGLPAHRQWLRPATIDEIPGNTVGEEAHDEALFEAGHGARAASNSTTAALWEWLAIGIRGHVKSGRLGQEDWP